MTRQEKEKRVRTSGQRGSAKRTPKRDLRPEKAAIRASDVYEAENRDPAEELEAGRRYDVSTSPSQCLGRILTVRGPVAFSIFVGTACRQLRIRAAGRL